MDIKIELKVNDTIYDITSFVKFPINLSFTLDKSLDTGTFIIPLIKKDSISGLDMSVPLEPFTPIRFTIDSIEYYYFTSEYAVKETSRGNGIYEHNVTIIEPTKILERYTLPNMTVTQPIGKNDVVYSSNIIDPAIKEIVESDYKDANGDWQDASNLVWKNPTIETGFTQVPLINNVQSGNQGVLDTRTLKQAGENYTISLELILWNVASRPNNFDLRYQDQREGTTVRIYANNNIIFEEFVTVTWKKQVREFIEVYFVSTPVSKNISFDYVPSVNNEEIRVEIDNTYRENDANVFFDSIQPEKANLSIFNTDKASIYSNTVTEIADKMIKICDLPSLDDDSFVPKFKLSSETESQFINIVVPETSFNSFSLWDGLNELGELIRAYPRIFNSFDETYEIDFDVIGEVNNELLLNTNVTAIEREQILNNFSTGMEINADNVIESINTNAIKVEPYPGGWLTFRLDKDGPDQITDTTSSIKVRQPIYQVRKITITGIEVTFSSTIFSSNTEWDISNYVVPYDVWLSLEDLPYDDKGSRLAELTGKGNTLYYQKNETRILNMGYRGKKNILVEPDQALYEIIKAVAQQSVPDEDFVSIDKPAIFQGVQARVEYIPKTNVRCRLYQDDSLGKEKNILFSNEKARFNDSDKLGNYTQSLVNRSGNDNLQLTGFDTSLNDIPKIGNFDEENNIVTNVDVSLVGNQVDYIATLYKDYANLNPNTSVVSEFRQYAVPTDQLVLRNDLYEEDIVVTVEDPNIADIPYTPTKADGFETMLYPLLNLTSTTFSSPQYVEAFNRWSSSDPNDPFDTRIDLPVETLGLGNSTIISCEYKNNYGAGDQRFQQIINGVPQEDVYLQEEYRYTDSFGFIESARLTFLNEGKQDNSVDDSDIYPQFDELSSGTELIELNIPVLKDAREIYKYSHQYNFYPGNTLILYSGIGKYNGMALTTSDIEIVPVLFLESIPPRDTLIANLGNIEISEFSNRNITTISNKYAQATFSIRLPANSQYVGWGLMERNTRELVLSVKTDIVNFGGADTSYNAKLNIYNN